MLGAGLDGILVPPHEYVNGDVPPEILAVQVTISPINAVEGEAEQVADIAFPETIRLKLVCLFSGEPVTVMKCVPAGVLGVTVKVITEVQVGEHELFEIEYEVPAGTPERKSVTVCVVPEIKLLVIVFWVKALPLVLVTLEFPELERL